MRTQEPHTRTAKYLLECILMRGSVPCATSATGKGDAAVAWLCACRWRVRLVSAGTCGGMDLHT